MRRLIAGCGLLLLTGCAASPRGDIAEPSALHASQPVPVNRVISAAIWVDPQDAARSRVIITNAARGIEVHDLDGTLLKHLDDGYETDSVAVLHDFKLDGKTTDLALATYPDARVDGVKMWQIDREKAKLRSLKSPDTFELPGDFRPLGIAAYRSPRTGKSYAFVTATAGDVEQFELTATDGGVAARPVRHLKLAGKAQGCVADEDSGVVYFAQEKTGVWRFPAEPDGGDDGTLVVRAGEHELRPDIEGVGLYATDADDGYLVVVGQGAKSDRSRLNLYDRRDAHYVGAIVPSAAGGNAVEFASGLAVTSRPLPQYPQGLLVVKDHTNANASEDFKYFSWADIARALNLRVSPTPAPAGPGSGVEVSGPTGAGVGATRPGRTR